MTKQIHVQIKRLENAKDIPLPYYGSDQAAGMDLHAAVEASVVLKPGERALIPTGYAIALPAGYEAQVRPRSGLALKSGLIVLNTPGTVDSDYRGELKVILANLGQEDFIVERGARIAQLVVAEHARVALIETETLDDTLRGEGGFGSTGLKQAS